MTDELFKILRQKLDNGEEIQPTLDAFIVMAKRAGRERRKLDK